MFHGCGGAEALTALLVQGNEHLLSALRSILRGWARAVGEREPDLTALAAPIRSSRGELEAIVALQGPSSRFYDAAVDAAAPLLVERAEAISRELGWRPG